jgi:hypothetical protein
MRVSTVFSPITFTLESKEELAYLIEAIVELQHHRRSAESRWNLRPYSSKEFSQNEQFTNNLHKALQMMKDKID